MKKVINFILLVASYFLICILNNIRNIMILGKSAIFTQGMLYTGPMVVSGIILLLMFIFHDKLKDYKKIKISTILVIFFCALMNGIFPNKQISRYIILYIVMLMNSVATTKLLKERFELSVFISSSVIVLVAIPFAMLNLLKVYKILLILFEIFVVIYLLLALRKSSFRDEIKEKINVSSLLVFSIMFVLLVLGGVNRYVHTWDEYSHWAFDAKAVIANEKLTTSQEVVSSTRSYPPLLSIWHYLSSIVLDFSEQNLYIWLSIYILVCLITAFTIFNGKNKWLIPFFAIVSFFSSRLFGSTYSYISLYADYASAVTFLTNFIIYLKYKDRKEDFSKMKRYLFLSLAMTTLIKPTGIVAAFVFFVIVFVDEYIKSENKKLTIKNFCNNFTNFLKKYFKLGISIVIIFVLWFAYVKICDITIEKFYDEEIIPTTLETSIKYKLNGNVFKNMFVSFVDVMESKLFDKYTLYQCLILFPVIICIFVMVKHKCKVRDALTKMLPYIIGAIAFYALTFLAIFVTFSAYEAGMLASFARYLNTFNVAMFLLSVIYICKDDFVKDSFGKIVCIISLVFILSMMKFSDITYSISDYFDRAETEKQVMNFNLRLRI